MIDQFSRGDLVEVSWTDIFEDSVGNPDSAELAVRISIAYYWGVRESHGIKCLVTTTTMDGKDHSQSGYCIYPEGVVKGVKMVRRKRGRGRGGASPAPSTGSLPQPESPTS